MTKLMEVYKCELCGNIVEMVHDGAGALVCCGEEMVLCAENTVDAAKEKHVPVIDKVGDKVKVSVGSVDHPMEEKHYIEWIQLNCSCGQTLREFLKPGQEPVAEFCASCCDGYTARAYCNLHGLWKNEA